MIYVASVWVTACAYLLPLSHASTKKPGNLYEKKLTALLDEAHRTTLHGKNLHEAKLASLIQNVTVAQHGSTPVLSGTPMTQRRTKFPPWHMLHSYSNETFEGQTVDYNCWKRPPKTSKELIAEFRKKYPRDKRPRYTKYNFTEIGSIFEQGFIDGHFNSKDYDYFREALKRNLTGIQHTRSPFDYLSTRQRKLKPWKKNYTDYVVDPDYYNEIVGINTTYPKWLSTPINKIDNMMIKQWLFQEGY